MSKSIFRNAETDSIDAQLGHDTRSAGRKAFDGIADTGYSLVRGFGKTIALSFAIAVGGAVALIAGKEFSPDTPTEEQPVDIQTFMDQYGIQGTPEEFLEKLIKDGIVDPSMVPFEVPGTEQQAEPKENIHPREKEPLIVLDNQAQTLEA